MNFLIPNKRRELRKNELLLYRLYLFRILVQYETILLGLKDLLL